MRRLMRWVGFWCLRQSHTPMISCAVQPDVPLVIVFVLEEHSPFIPSLLLGAVHTYCSAYNLPLPSVEPVTDTVH